MKKFILGVLTLIVPFILVWTGYTLNDSASCIAVGLLLGATMRICLDKKNDSEDAFWLSLCLNALITAGFLGVYCLASSIDGQHNSMNTAKLFLSGAYLFLIATAICVMRLIYDYTLTTFKKWQTVAVLVCASALVVLCVKLAGETIFGWNIPKVLSVALSGVLIISGVLSLMSTCVRKEKQPETNL
ncbi:MAG: hypothetical protein J6Y91_06060 [Alphaproteobacteria bacterium]|nr:hypothetical protein [Alphaproteobacteria bacterium]